MRTPEFWGTLGNPIVKQVHQTSCGLQKTTVVNRWLWYRGKSGQTSELGVLVLERFGFHDPISFRKKVSRVQLCHSKLQNLVRLPGRMPKTRIFCGLTSQFWTCSCPIAILLSFSFCWGNLLQLRFCAPVASVPLQVALALRPVILPIQAQTRWNGFDIVHNIHNSYKPRYARVN